MWISSSPPLGRAESHGPDSAMSFFPRKKKKKAHAGWHTAAAPCCLDGEMKRPIPRGWTPARWAPPRRLPVSETLAHLKNQGLGSLQAPCLKRQGKLQRSKNLPLGFPGRAGGASHQQPPRREKASSSEHAGSFLHAFICS